MYQDYDVNAKDLENLSKKDPRMESLISSVGDIKRQVIRDPFTALINTVVFQQLSFKAANTIWQRLTLLSGNLTPSALISLSHSELRECGLSNSKVNYVKDISFYAEKGYLDINILSTMTDSELVKHLTAIKGIGIWSAEMFMIFCLKRRDILSYSDLGIRKGIKMLHCLEKEPTKGEFDYYKTLYSPYGTLASFYLWEIK